MRRGKTKNPARMTPFDRKHPAVAKLIEARKYLLLRHNEIPLKAKNANQASVQRVMKKMEAGLKMVKKSIEDLIREGENFKDFRID